MISRKQCINIPTATYSGKEMSPLRYGISAEEFDVGVVKDGHDGLNWIVKIKNNRKVWVRIYVPCDKMVHEIHKIDKSEDPVIPVEVTKPAKVTKAADTAEAANATEDIQSTDTVQAKEIVEEVIDEEQPIIKNIKEKKNIESSKNGKKLTNYNIFLAYRLSKLKEHYATAGSGDKKSNKEIFAEVLAEWKNIDKQSQEFKDIMIEAEEFNLNK